MSGYIAGIAFFDEFFTAADLVMELSFLLLTMLIITFWGYRTDSIFRSYFSISVFLLWFAAGGIQLYFQQSDLRLAHFENVFLPENQLLVEAEDVSPTSSAIYTKAIGRVNAVISGKDTISTIGKVLLYFETDSTAIERNDVFLVRPILNPVSNRNNPGEFDAERYWKYQEIHLQSFVPENNYILLYKANPSFLNIFLNCRDYLAAIIDRYLDGQEAAVAKGLILGDRSSIERETTRMFGNTGAMHILAVSGMHVTILVQLLSYFLQLFPKYISKRKALVISLVFVWTYCLMTGFSASVARAAWMFSIVSGSVLLNRNYSPINGLLFSALIILIITPYSLFDIGFQLSYAAMIGIYTFFPYLRKQLYFKNKWIHNLWEGTALGIAAQLITTPISLYYFNQFPNYFALTNIALAAYSNVILILGIVLFSVGWWKLAGKGTAFLLFWVMFSMLWIIQFIDRLPQSISEGFTVSAWIVVLLYVLIAAFYRTLILRRYRQLTAVLGISLVVVVSIVYTRFRNMNTSRFIVFNNNELLFAIKKDRHLFLFYDPEKMKPKHLDQLVSSFQKVFPSEIKDTILLSNEKIIELTIDQLQLKVESGRGGYNVKLSQQEYFLATKSKYSAGEKRVILSPVLNDETVFHQLNKGAFHLEIP
ncbi:MAG: ComEC/Rec2 family competence protein [Flavobacteriia bacterium]|nr:ComEC/Rec2 family competence protein [Flavobacteriia bacterium]OJX38497.1 MAG: hypothetical protein BGO87_10285 [Flavobacteriia bacterium 40-80]